MLLEAYQDYFETSFENDYIQNPEKANKRLTLVRTNLTSANDLPPPPVAIVAPIDPFETFVSQSPTTRKRQKIRRPGDKGGTPKAVYKPYVADALLWASEHAIMPSKAEITLEVVRLMEEDGILRIENKEAKQGDYMPLGDGRPRYSPTIGIIVTKDFRGLVDENWRPTAIGKTEFRKLVSNYFRKRRHIA